MTVETIELDNFIVLIEQTIANETVLEKCALGKKAVGFAFFGTGNRSIEISYGEEKSILDISTGIVTSFFGTEIVKFVHEISGKNPIQCIAVFTTTDYLKIITEQEDGSYPKQLHELLHPNGSFVKGPDFHMTADMLNAVNKIINTHYTGATKKIFLESQVMELLSHFFGLAASHDTNEGGINALDKEKLQLAKKILLEKLNDPPSLTELSKLTGLNNHKLKKQFKELFGMPVYKYLQNERLSKANYLLRSDDISIQEAAWFVGYESLSSFSNAFLKKFGYRPSEIKRQIQNSNSNN